MTTNVFNTEKLTTIHISNTHGYEIIDTTTDSVFLKLNDYEELDFIRKKIQKNPDKMEKNELEYLLKIKRRYKYDDIQAKVGKITAMPTSKLCKNPYKSRKILFGGLFQGYNFEDVYREFLKFEDELDNDDDLLDKLGSIEKEMLNGDGIPLEDENELKKRYGL